MLALDHARASYWEDPTGALATAIECAETARVLGDASIRARALALQGAITLHRGDMHGAMAIATEAEAELRPGDDAAAAEVAALQALVTYFSGSYGHALAHAERAAEVADRTGDLALRIFVRRAGCPVYGNLGVDDLPQRVEELLELTLAAGDRWEEAVSRNDRGCLLAAGGDVAGAERELARGMELAAALAPRNNFALALLHSTRADLRLGTGEPAGALADAERAIAFLLATGEANPYVFGVTVRAHVQALQGLGRLDEARASGEGALERLGERVPQARSMILATVAEALREAGRLEEAYDTLARSAQLEREAFHELAQLQVGIERARLEATAARREAARLAEQADRDHLTGVHNRRYLARELERMTAGGVAGRFSLAVLDLDRFKTVNDVHGHDVGDHVLMRVAALLVDGLRARDTVVRTGGEEFVILMPETEPRAAAACCERLGDAIRAEDWDALAPGLTVTASIGLACSTGEIDVESLAKLADRRLYEAKRGGRDRVVA
jgi:diguanylate cyclase (GGDEF)-like protein